MRRGWILIALLVGCPSQEGERPTVAPGRLRAQYLDAGGGARRFTGWFDAELDAPCAFELGADGRYRCLPGYQGGLGGFGINGRVHGGDFSDSECTEPILTRLCAGAEVPRFVRTYPPRRPGSEPVPCASEPRPDPEVRGLTGRAHQLGEYFAMWNGVCLRAASSSDDGVFYELSAPIPEWRFVRAEQVLEPKSDRLAAWVLVGEDGSRQNQGLFDRARGSDCALDDEGRCLPSDGRTAYAGTGTIALDAGCQRPIAVGQRGCQSPELLVTNTVAPFPACTRTSSIATITRVVPPEELMTIYGEGQCLPWAQPAGLAMSGFEVSAEPVDLPRLERARIGEGPIVLEAWAENGAIIDDTGWFIDAGTDRRCWLEASGEPGVMLCAPEYGLHVSGEMFADAACIQRATSVPNFDACFWGPSPLAVVLLPSTSGACGQPGGIEVRPILGELDGTEHWSIPGTGCVEVPTGGNARLFALGEPLDTRAWPRIRQVTE